MNIAKTQHCFDIVFQESFDKKSHLDYTMRTDHGRSSADFRRVLYGAQRFVLDKSMSEFLADLAFLPFSSVAKARRPEILDSIRHSALLPGDKIWVEYDAVAFQNRRLNLKDSNERFFEYITQAIALDHEYDNTCDRNGWLIERSTFDETIISMTCFNIFPEQKNGGKLVAGILPWKITWSARDVPLRNYDRSLSFLAHGIPGVETPYISVEILDHAGPDEEYYQDINIENGILVNVPDVILDHLGEGLCCLTFLASLNDIPTKIEHIAPAKGGFLGDKRIRKFLGASIISLNIPSTISRLTFAKRLLAKIRMRRHEVRGHWRIQNGGNGSCVDLHCWSEIDETMHSFCKCNAKRRWIDKHERGDASLGFVRHSYEISHSPASSQ